MLQKKHFVYRISIFAISLSFFGCGGEGTENFSWNTEGNSIFISKSNLPGKVQIENAEQGISETFSANLKKIEPTQSDLTAYQNTENSIQQNQPVAITLKYNAISDNLSRVTVTSQNTQIGENFIYFKADQHKEGLMQALNLKEELKGFATYIKHINASFLLNQDRDTMMTSLNTAPEKPEQTVNLTLQKTTTGDYQFSNVQVSGLTLAQNNFTLKNEQYATTDLKKLQLMLSTLFVNFAASKEIFN